MKENYCGQIVFMAENFNSDADYRRAVGQQIFILMQAHYKLKVYTELGEVNQVIIEFGYDNPDFEQHLVWCDEDDLEAIANDRYARENEQEK